MQTNYHLSQGETLQLHWRLTDLELVNVPDTQRATVKLHTFACWGQMTTHVKGFAVEFPTAKTAWYTHNGTDGHGKLTFPFVHSNYMITVNSQMGGNFSIIASTQPNLIPLPGNNGMILLQQMSEHSIEVQWLEADSLVPVKYELYYNVFNNDQRIQNISQDQLKVCQDRGTAMGPCVDERAIMNTPCGCRRNGILAATLFADDSVAFESSTSESTTARFQFEWDINEEKSKRPRMYSARIDDLPLNTPIYLNVVAVPLAPSYEQYQVAYSGRSLALSFDRVVSVFDETMMHVYIAASVYGMAGLLLIVASIQKVRIHGIVNAATNDGGGES